MNRVLTSFILTSLAGITTLVGYLFVYLKCRKEKIIPIALGFSAGIMLFISLCDLIPNSYHYFNDKYTSIYALICSLLFLILGFGLTFSSRLIINENDNLYRIGILSLITLMLHNIPEGIITYLTSTIEIKTGLLLTYQ